MSTTNTETATAPEGTCETPSCDVPAAEATQGPTAITVTETAAGEIKRVITEKQMPESTVLRVGVAGGGCSGFQYSLGFDDKCDEAADFVSVQHGIRVAVDKKSALFLEGTLVDFYEGLDKRGFTFNNPNATNSCGCGSSFSA